MQTQGKRPFTVRYTVNPQTGRVASKLESGEGRHEEYAYTYDAKGHLLEVRRNDCLAEQYTFNALGQRVRGMVCYASGYYDPTTIYIYDERGCLIRAGMAEYIYDMAGNLAVCRSGPSRETSFVYENNLLREVRLPDGDVLRYEYDAQSPNPVGPVRKYKNGALVMEYAWLGLLHLRACADRENGLVYFPQYDKKGHLAAVKIRAAKGLPTLPGARGGETVLHCVCDQVGTPKVFRASMGGAAKHLWYDSFGNLYNDSMPDLHIPVGFAGGLADKDTGLVRFGYRDYDPATGRFTCPDPLGDTGGDHDLYDYCVDDPVSLVDPTGLYNVAMGQHVARIASRYASTAATAARSGAQQVAQKAQSAGRAVADGGKQAIKAVGDKLGPMKDKAAETVQRAKEIAGRAGERMADASREADIATGSGKVASSAAGKAVQAGTVGGQFAVGFTAPHDGNLPNSLPQGLGTVAERGISKADSIKSAIQDVELSIKEGAKKAKNIKRSDVL